MTATEYAPDPEKPSRPRSRSIQVSVGERWSVWFRAGDALPLVKMTGVVEELRETGLRFEGKLKAILFSEIREMRREED